VAWFASHRHTENGANEPYAYSYLFAYGIDAPPNAETLTLPKNEKIRILAVSVADESPLVHAAQVLTDPLEK
jgi:alpha-mannosidase